MMIPTTQNAAVVESVMRDLTRMRPLPAVVMQAVQLLADPQVNINRVGQVLTADQVIAAQILRHANSAYYGGRTPCATVADGIMRIGIRQVKSVLYSVSANQMLNIHLMKSDLFRHSQAVAAVARRLATLLHRADPEEAFTAGLLHDIGKLLLDRHTRPHYRAMAEMIHQGHSPIRAEEKFLGTDHATIGGLIAERWQFPRVLVEAIRYHHAPTLSYRPQLPALVIYADHFVLQAGIGLTPLGIPPLPPDTLQILGFQPHRADFLAQIIQPEIELANKQFEETVGSRNI
ncbi:MAG: HDOD domain-containing protein [Chloroflexi bacterium]|nr:HDOD domain-containing protein [Chloroflexota bacterium]